MAAAAPQKIDIKATERTVELTLCHSIKHTFWGFWFSIEKVHDRLLFSLPHHKIYDGVYATDKHRNFVLDSAQWALFFCNLSFFISPISI